MKLYKLKIMLDPDKDFYHESELFKNSNTEEIFYFTNRDKACEFLMRFYTKLAKTIGTSKEYMIDKINIIKDFEDHLYDIIHKMSTFEIIFKLGNPTFEIKLLEANVRNCEIDTYEYIDFDPFYRFYIGESYTLDYNWEVLKTFKNV